MVEFYILEIKWLLLFYFMGYLYQSRHLISNLIKRGNPAIKMENLMRKSFIHNLTYCILMVLLLTGFGFAANTLEVKCVDENGQPVEKAKVKAFALKNVKASNKKTNKTGIATFKKMKDDYYRVWVEAKGYSKALKEFIPIFNDAQEKIEIVLSSGNEKDPLYFEDNLIRERADTLFKAGTEAIQQRKLPEAEKRLADSIALNPSQINANNNLAFIYFSTSRVDEAKVCYERVINIAEAFKYLDDDPNNIALYDQQIKQTSELLETMPLQMLAAEVDKSMKAEDFDTAVEKLDEMIAMQPENPGAYFQKAIALTRLNRLEDANTAINKAIEFDPAQTAFKDLQKRIVLMKKAVVTNKVRDDLLEIDKLNTSGNYEEALSSLDKMGSDTPEELKGAFWWIKGRAHRGLDQKDEMIQSYEKALRNEKDSKNQGIYLNEMSNWLLDKKYLDDLLEIYPTIAPIASIDVPNGLSAIADRLKRQGDQSGAKSVFEKIIEVSPETAEPYYELGVIYFYEVDDKAQAKVHLEKYIEIGKDQDRLNSAKDFITLMASQK
jgi:tetratricopeptide (TPR) repeat protein